MKKYEVNMKEYNNMEKYEGNMTKYIGRRTWKNSGLPAGGGKILRVRERRHNS